MSHTSQKQKEILKHGSIKEKIVQEFFKCNRTVLNNPAPTDGVYCPAVFDGWHCFNYTKGGTTAFANCLPLESWDRKQKVHRYCEPNGTWEINEIRGSPWSNTTDCDKNNAFKPIGTLDKDHIHIYLYLAGATLSLILLITSLAIFSGFKQLRCGRVVIHQNLYVSLVFTALCYIFYYTIVVLDGEVQIDNPLWCQALHIICQYFTLSNFSWMFFESLYLHIILTFALTTSKTAIKIIISCAWGIPLLITVVYGLVRAYVTGEIIYCWVGDESNAIYIIAVPIFVSLVLNIVMLFNMVRIIKTKLQRTPEAGHNRALNLDVIAGIGFLKGNSIVLINPKAIKAVLILVPMFGLQFLVFPFKPDPETDAFYVYLNIMAFLMSTQGTWVSIIFCFCNGEVRSLLRRKWHQYLLMSNRSKRNNALTSSTYGDPYSVIDTKREASNSQKVNITWDVNVSEKDGMEMKPLTEPVENGTGPVAKDIDM